MSCWEWEERVALHVGGDLGPAESAQVREHLESCDGCRQAAAEIRGSLDLLREAHAEAMAPVHLAAVRTQVLERLARPPLWRRAWVLGPAMGAAALAASVAVILAPWTAPPPPPAPVLVRFAVTAPVPPPVVTRAPRRRPEAPPAAPLVVRLITDDPDVVLYWIADRKGE